MAYSDRTATTGTPIELTFRKVIDLPAMPDTYNSFGMPCFLAGDHIIQGTVNYHGSNQPLIWQDFYSDPPTPLAQGSVAFGASHADYGLRSFGTGVNDYAGQQYSVTGFIDGAIFGYSTSSDDSATVQMGYTRQGAGVFTGGTAGVVALNAYETFDIVWDKAVDVPGDGIIIPSLASTASVPEALFVMMPSYIDGNKDKCNALKIGVTGTPTKISLYQTAGELSAPLVSCRSGTTHYFLRDIAGGGFAFTTCVENPFLTYTGANHYNPKFSDPNLPASMADFWWGTDSEFELTHVYGTDRGFLIGFKQDVAGTWEPKWILVDKAWTTVQFITAEAGDATAAAILAQGIGSYNEDGGEISPVSMMFEGDYAWLLGGTNEAPLIVEAGFGVTNEDTILRVWGFSLDGHDFYCLRLGGSGTIIYDLTTNQICEWASPDDTKWRAHVGQNWVGMDATTFANDFGSDVVAGDDTAGILWVLDPTAGQDDDATTGDPVSYTRKVTGELQVSGRDAMPCGAVTLDLSVGDPVDISATITLRTSDDLGNSFRSHGAQTITAGDFGAVVEWRGCGLIRAPGRIFQISDTGAAVRISAANMR